MIKMRGDHSGEREILPSPDGFYSWVNNENYISQINRRKSNFKMHAWGSHLSMKIPKIVR